MSPDAIPEFLNAQGEMATHMRGFDWSATPLGQPTNWPSGLQSAVRNMLASGHPMLIWWGEQRIQLYNDAHVPSLPQERHPGALGRPGPEIWPESWDSLAPQIDRVLSGSGAGWYQDHPLQITRNGVPETTHWTYSLDAIPDPAAPNGIGGVMLIGTDTTQTFRALRETTERLAARTAEHAEAALGQARLRAVIDSSDQLLGFILPNGTLRDANPVALRAIRATLSDIAGQKFWTTPWFAATPGLPAQIEADFNRALAGEIIHREIHVTATAGERAFDFSLHPAHDE